MKPAAMPRRVQLRPRTNRRAFSLIELVMVLSTMAFVAAIAVPRMSSAADNSKSAALASTVRNMQFAFELYAAEHFDRSPMENPDGSFETSAALVMNRLLKKSDEQGTIAAAGAFGPYLKQWPVNPLNGLSTLRIGAPAAGAGTHGWHIATGSRSIASDRAVFTPAKVNTNPLGGGAVEAVTADSGATAVLGG